MAYVHFDHRPVTVEDLASFGAEKEAKLVVADRQTQYGAPLDDFTRVADMLSALGFQFAASDGSIRKLKAEDIPIIMTCIKLSREVHKHKDDNIVDIHGYMRCLEQVLAGRKKDKDEYCHCGQCVPGDKKHYLGEVAVPSGAQIVQV